jgi:short-subunit dehydrogenase
VIGVGSKMGLSLAQRFGEEGYEVALVARNEDSLASFVDILHGAGIQSSAYSADMSEDGEASRVMGLIEHRYGAIDVLIYNAAALGVRATPSDMSLETFYGTLRVNLVSALVAAQCAIPGMRRNGRGTILFSNGTWALHPSAQYAPIGLAKAALLNLTESLFEELSPDGIHVATVIISGRIEKGTEFDPDRLAALYWRIHQQDRADWSYAVHR